MFNRKGEKWLMRQITAIVKNSSLSDGSEKKDAVKTASNEAVSVIIS